ncbi:hypothetical protein [Streptomyces indiaensis]|nr:hypothetical protein [Streptomyces indiaensis]
MQRDPREVDAGQLWAVHASLLGGGGSGLGHLDLAAHLRVHQLAG